MAILHYHLKWAYALLESANLCTRGSRDEGLVDLKELKEKNEKMKALLMEKKALLKVKADMLIKMAEMLKVNEEMLKVNEEKLRASKQWIWSVKLKKEKSFVLISITWYTDTLKFHMSLILWAHEIWISKYLNFKK